MLKNLTASAVLSQMIAASLVYYLLLSDTFHFSISHIILYANTLPIKQHIWLLGLLPIYIGAVVFGAAILGVRLGRRLQTLFTKQKKMQNLRFNAKFESEI